MISNNVALKTLLSTAYEDQILDRLAPQYPTTKISYLNFFKFFESSTHNEKWMKEHPDLTAKMICRAHELLERNVFPKHQAKRVREILLKELPDVKEIVKGKIDRPDLFNSLIDGIDHHHIEMPPEENVQEMISDMEVLLDYGAEFYVDQSAHELIADALLEKIDTDVEGKIAFETCVSLLHLVEREVDITPLLKSNNFMNRALNYAIENFKDNEIKERLIELLNHPQFAECSTKVRVNIPQDLTKSEFDELIGMLPIGLKEINLSNLSITNLKKFEKFVNLKKINLNNSFINDINGINNFKKLKELNLSNCKSIKNIRSLVGLNNLKKLNLENCNISEDSFKHFIIEFKNFPELDLRHNSEKLDNVMRSVGQQHSFMNDRIKKTVRNL